MAKKLYVGNLSFNTSESTIRELFAQCGEITEANIIMDRDTGRSKGFGFIEMVSDEAAQAAITKFNGYTLDDRALTVNEARPREERSGNGFGGGYGGSRSGGNRNSGNRNRY